MANVTRISVDMPNDLHKMMKHIAIHNEVSVRDYVIEAIQEKMRKEAPTKTRKKTLKGAALTLKTIADSKKGIGLKHYKSLDDFFAEFGI